MVLRALAVIVATALLGAAGPVHDAGATAPDESSTRTFAPRLWVMHDSIMYAASDDLRAELPYHHISFSGWPGYTVSAAPHLVRHDRHLIDNIVVVSLGTNYLRDAERFRHGVHQTMAELAGVSRVVWITPQIYRDDIHDVVDVLEDEARRRPNLELLDWTSVVADRPDLTRPLDVHLSPAGERVFARLIARAVTDGTSYDHAPVGRLRVRARRAGVVVQGWAKDPVDGRPATVRVLADGTEVALLAGRDRAGYRTVLSLPDGTHEICAVAIDPGAGRDRRLGCRMVQAESDPRGVLALVATDGGVRARGWALDPDGRRPLAVTLRVDGSALATIRADGWRPDVDAAFGLGARHGFVADVEAAPGATVCLHVANIFGGVDRTAACRVVPAG